MVSLPTGTARRRIQAGECNVEECFHRTSKGGVILTPHLLLFFVNDLPMTTIATSHTANMRHFCNMAFDGCNSFFT